MTRILLPGMIISMAIFFTSCSIPRYIPYRSDGFREQEKKQDYFLAESERAGFSNRMSGAFFSKKNAKDFQHTNLFDTLKQIGKYLNPIYAGYRLNQEQLPEYSLLFSIAHAADIEPVISKGYQAVEKFFDNTNHNFDLGPMKQRRFYYARQGNEFNAFVFITDFQRREEYLIAFSSRYDSIERLTSQLYRWDVFKTDDTVRNYKLSTSRAAVSDDSLLQVYANWRLYEMASSLTSDIGWLTTNFAALADKAFNSASGPDYIKPVALLKEQEKKMGAHEINYRKQNEYYQYLATYLSFQGKHTEAMEAAANISTPPPPLKLPEGFSTVNAAREIIDQVRNEKIIAFNEAHHDVRARAFLFSLLDSLRQEGFTHLALEDLRTGTEELPVTVRSGFYVREPLYHSLIEKARSLGFTLIAYDEKLTDFTERDKKSTRRLLRSFDASRDRLIIFCGYDHLTKSDMPKKNGTLIENIWSETGSEPYTINLATNRSREVEGVSDPFFYIIKNRITGAYHPSQPARSVSVYPPSGKPAFDYGYFYENRLAPFYRYGYQLPAKDSLSIFVYGQNDAKDLLNALPVFVKANASAGDRVYLYLPVKGEYQVVLKNEENDIVKQESIIVK